MRTSTSSEPGSLPLLGYWLSSEEHGPRQLVRNAVAAEEAGFELAALSDHFHPWTTTQGNAPFAWTILGAIAEATERLTVGTAVSAPILRINPAIVAQAAATTAMLFEGRFFLGVGTGERLNEGVVGQPWPPAPARRHALEDALRVMHRLFAGERVSVESELFRVRDARLYSRPAVPPPVYVAAGGAPTAQLAAEHADGLIGVEPAASLVEAYRTAGGGGPTIGQLHVCWAHTREEAEATALKWWPVGALRGRLLSELARPDDFDDAVATVRVEDITSTVVCGPDAQPVVDAIGRFLAAGFTSVVLHQVGPDQQGFLDWFGREVATGFPLARAG